MFPFVALRERGIALKIRARQIIQKDIKFCIEKIFPPLRQMIKAKPWVVAAELEKELGLKVIAASDGMKIDLEEV